MTAGIVIYWDIGRVLVEPQVQMKLIRMAYILKFNKGRESVTNSGLKKCQE